MLHVSYEQLCKINRLEEFMFLSLLLFFLKKLTAEKNRVFIYVDANSLLTHHYIINLNPAMM